MHDENKIGIDLLYYAFKFAKNYKRYNYFKGVSWGIELSQNLQWPQIGGKKDKIYSFWAIVYDLGNIS